MTKIEEIARAIHESHGFVKGWNDPDTVRRWHPVRMREAMVALQALREPTVGMQDAARWATTHFPEIERQAEDAARKGMSDIFAAKRRAELTIVWQAMIDHLIQEGKK